MNEIGAKIKKQRKQKGLSQEELAESASVNLRTIQRIENNKNEPRGNTLNQICKVLEINAEEILDYGKQPDNSYLVFFHLSVLSYLVFPLGNIILPMILWQTKKDKVIGLKDAGANLLNYQIVWTVFLTLSIINMMFAILNIPHIFSYHTVILVFIGLNVLNIIFPIYFACKSKKGDTEKKYPIILKLIK